MKSNNLTPILVGVVFAVVAMIVNYQTIANIREKAASGATATSSAAEGEKAEAIETASFCKFKAPVKTGAVINKENLETVKLPKDYESAYVRAEYAGAAYGSRAVRDYSANEFLPASQLAGFAGEEFAVLGPFKVLEQTATSVVVAANYSGNRFGAKEQKLFELAYLKGTNKSSPILAAVRFKDYETGAITPSAALDDAVEGESDDSRRYAPDELGPDATKNVSRNLGEDEVAITVPVPNGKIFSFAAEDQVGFLLPAAYAPEELRFKLSDTKKPQ